MFCVRHASLGRHFRPLDLECYRAQSIRRRFAFHCNQTASLSASRMERGDGLVKRLETAVPPCPAPRENICVASQNAGEVESLIGDPKFGWLKRLKRSHRR